MRKFYWYLTTYIKKYGLVFLASVVGAILVFSLIIPSLSNIVARKKSHYIGMVGDYSLNSLPLKIKKQLSAGLTEITEDKEVIPLLAERWIVEDEGKKYRFLLKKNIKWQDGKVLEPEDIQYQFADVETLTTPNDVIFQLPDTFTPFPSVVSEPVLRSFTEKYNLFFERTNLLGIGEFRLIDYKRQGSKLKEVVIEGPHDRFIYRFYLTEANAILAFKRGEIDILQDLTDPRDLVEWKTVQVTPTLQTNRYLAVFFNNSSPKLSKNIRQGLSYGLEKPSGETRARGPIDSASWAYLEGGKSYEKNLERAVERLVDGLPPQTLEMELATTINFQQEAESIKQQWEELGELAVTHCLENNDENKDLCENLRLKINIKITNFPDTSNFELLLLGQDSPPDPDQYFLWHSEQPTNFTRYKNTRIDSLLEKGRKTLEQNERLAVYQEFQQFLLEDPPAIFLRNLESFEVRRK